MENIAELFEQMWDVADRKSKEATDGLSCDGANEDEAEVLRRMWTDTTREKYLGIMVDMYNPERTRGMMSDI
jgi:hypothetical protein